MSINAEVLAAEVDAELLDPRFLRRTHGHRKTYDANCRGPLCSLAAAQYQMSHRTRKPEHKPNVRSLRRQELADALAAIAEEKGLLVKNP